MLDFVLFTTLFINICTLENPLPPCRPGFFRSEDTNCQNCSVHCNTFWNNGQPLPENCNKLCNKISTTQIVTILNNTGSSKTNKIIVNSTIPIDNDPNSSKPKAINYTVRIVVASIIVVAAIIAVILVVAIRKYKKKGKNSSPVRREGFLIIPNDSSDLNNMNILLEGETVNQSAASDSLRPPNSSNNNKIYYDVMNEKHKNSSPGRREGFLIKPNDSSDLNNLNILPEGETVNQSAAFDSLLSPNSSNNNKIYYDLMNVSVQVEGLVNNDNSSNDTESEKHKNSSPVRREGFLIKPNDSSDLNNMNILPEGETVNQSAAFDSLLSPNSSNNNKIYYDLMNESVQVEGLVNNDNSSNDTESDSLYNMPSRQLTEMNQRQPIMLMPESGFGKASYDV